MAKYIKDLVKGDYLNYDDGYTGKTKIFIVINKIEVKEEGRVYFVFSEVIIGWQFKETQIIERNLFFKDTLLVSEARAFLEENY